MPTLTLILPVYNGSKYIGRCLDSILANTYADYELIIINDGSTDMTATICDAYAERDNRITVIHNSNNGVSFSRNLGIEKAKGEWIGFIDADDWIAPNAFESIVEKTRLDETDMVCFSFWSVLNDTKHRVILPNTVQGKIQFIKEQLLCGWTVVWNTYVRKDLLNRYAIRFNHKIAIGEDFELLFRAYYYARNIVVIDEPLYYYNRMNENSALHTITIKQYDDIINAQLSIIDFFKENGVFDKFEDIMSWKILKAKQDFVLDVNTHQKFLSIYPDSHRYILSCPMINIKIKIMMWLLTHHMGFVTAMFNRVRTLVKQGS